MEIKTLKISDWIIKTSVDEDDHLTLVVSNTDDTDIHDCFAEIGTDNTQYSVRLTTDGIENEYESNFSWRSL